MKYSEKQEKYIFAPYVEHSTLLLIHNMEKFNLEYSTKNIPIPSERNYKLKLMEKIELVIKRMRWKAIFFDNKYNQGKFPERYGLKTFYCPSSIKEMSQFEKDLLELVKNVKFRKYRSSFQLKLNNDITVIRNSTLTMTPADKTSNIYRLSKEQYNHVLANSITSTYKKTNSKIKDQINAKGKQLMKNSDTISRMEINNENNCFFTLKDHKENFINNPTVRLINPAKNELGRISKSILDQINLDLKSVLKVNQWKNTDNVLDWFNCIENKSAHKFLVFDIKDFYPSINESLLKNAIQFAEKHTHITEENKAIIFHARKSLLFSNNNTWMKKESSLFDVTMGAYDGAEVCELVGTFILYQISTKYDKSNIGIYRDDGLAVFKNKSGPESEAIKKDFQRIFNSNGLQITIQCNIKIVNYLDVTLNLSDSTHRPYNKPDSEIKYIHTESNHPPSVIKQIPISIEKRLSKLSSNETIFNQSTHVYEEALSKSGHNKKLTYTTSNTGTRSKQRRKRNIIWFNPPFSKSVSTKVARYFLYLVDKHFPPHHKFYKIFNRNTLKVSYSCMPNMHSVINSHNHKVLQVSDQPKKPKTCNCMKKEECPLNQECLEKSIIYKAIITSDTTDYKERVYIGLCETSFKKRYANHRKSFNFEKYRNESELSKEVWKIKDTGNNYFIKWSIIRKCPSYNQSTKRCLLCINEKTDIALYKENNLLNKKSELVSKCRHQNKFSLSRFDTKD